MGLEQEDEQYLLLFLHFFGRLQCYCGHGLHFGWHGGFVVVAFVDVVIVVVGGRSGGGGGGGGVVVFTFLHNNRGER